MSEGYTAWVGREESRTEHLNANTVIAMAATLDWEQAPAEGDALPPGWQWLFFNGAARRSKLGTDGHPQRGGFLPPIELPRRMWAGSRVRYVGDLPIGAQAHRHSRILKIENKIGKRGSLWFVTVQHTISWQQQDCIVEEQDIVYREATPTAPTVSAEIAKPARHEEVAQWGREMQPDTTLLFRYSALTFNGHRIHYDQTYARQEEGYPDLVVHGPLTATLLQQLAVEQSAGRRLASFDFRGVSPLFVSRSFQVEGREAEGGGVDLWARGPNGELAMSAKATYRG